MRVVVAVAAAAALLAAGEVTVYGTKVSGKDNQIEFNEPFTLDYDAFYLEADYGHYDHNGSHLTTRKKVELIHDKKTIFYSRTGEYDLEKKEFKLGDFFLGDTSSNLWIKGEKVVGNRRYLTVKDAEVSSCNVECADWKFRFDRGRYDRQKEWVNLYHVAFYVQDTPVLYLPYIGFSTVRERKTGFLRPMLGYSGEEGLFYIQPFFYAPTNWWDLELDPQIRTKRGKGIYGTFRFVDSPYSEGMITAGIFKEKDSYREEYNIKNSQHYGIQIRYKRNHIFDDYPDEGSEDGFYADLKFYNDIEYFVLQENGGLNYSRILDISRLNYYYSTDKNYFDTTARYYKYNDDRDTEPVHILPSIRFDHYLERPFEKLNFTYSTDAVATNYYQKDGTSALEYRLTLPVKYYFDLFDDYLGFSIGDEVEFLYADYYGPGADESDMQNYKLFRHTPQVALYGDLGRSYDSFFHAISYDVRILSPDIINESGERAKFIYLLDRTKRVESSLRQFIYPHEGDWDAYYFLANKFDYENPDEYNDLINELGFNTERLTTYFNLTYSIADDYIKSWSGSVSYSKKKAYDVSVSYIYHKNPNLTDEWRQEGRFLVASASRQITKRDKVFASVAYNLQSDTYKGWSVGWQRKERCWSLYMEYKRDTKPQITSDGVSYYRNSTFLVRLELYPLGAVSKSFSQTSGRRDF